MTTFLLIRHALTDAVGKRITGRTAGVHLNEEGRRQAFALAEQLAALPITAIYSSPLERAMQTAEPLAAVLEKPVIPTNDFLEIDFGKWTNNTLEELNTMPLFNQFNQFRSNTRIPGGELMLEAQTRMVAGMQQLCSQHNGEMVAIVSHADMIKAAVLFYCGMPLDFFQRIEISPASVTRLEVDEYNSRLTLLNYTGGLE